MAGPLSGRHALVTGAARGIGLAIATRLAEAGAHAIIHDRDVVAADAATTDLRARGLAALALIADLAEAAAPAAMAVELKAKRCEPDILVLCASVETLETWDAVSETAMAAQTEINLHATVRLLQAFLPGMLARGFGRVIAIGSVQEARPNPTHFYYAATKAAQTNMILNLARTTQAPDLTFNIVKPGAILTDRNRAVLAQPGREEQVLARIPVGRLGRADDCAGVALLLCSREGSYINGAEIAVDGGLRL
ncbi:SDR family oxidoreductase [Bosea sp. (in: a-proteobacteria)]|jgi:NAD(P)-dependent dehydrogenase (short-subunit alcohol dehydrogenase family)|uniref:SDR family NAD(P)-dependent oxidoreductase n=1 Tax=Bosea sp. (in: a-proteobacteria) TaxID=1871050 RepID=UPI002DDCBCD9|nr:SDR family oxidoreductase [Bosea sp. (in: a-proteobacteria)]HEV2511001.1 SDR family oxidoreductase [Bosea sp. (in: a-proteobacteria)]